MRVNPEKEDQGQKSRRNGLEWPLDPKQVAQWTVLSGFTIYDGVVVIPSLHVLPLNITILAILWISNVVSQLLASYIDPKESSVEYGTQENTVFRRTPQNPHVIRNLYCNICKASVQRQTKHCRACNKCVEVFDHHCDWLNNCIGFHNYIYFFAAVLTAILLCIFVLATCVVHIVGLNGHPNLLRPDYFINGDSSRVALTVVASIISAFVTLILFFLLQLLLLHIKLLMAGMTTYEYIISKRDAKAAKEKAARLEEGIKNESFEEVGLKTVSERVSPPPRLKSASGTVVTVNDIETMS